MMTGVQYKASLDDGRHTYLEGEQVHDIPNHPLLAATADFTALVYDRFYDPDPNTVSPLLDVPRSTDGLRQMLATLNETGLLAHGTSSTIRTLTTVSQRMAEGAPQYLDRIAAYIDHAQRADIRITQCITDAKGDRSKPPSKQDDPDAYLRVVDRQRDGVVLRGAKLHITGASLGHELMTIPTKAMKPGEEDYSIAAMVPVNAPGVKIINTTYAPRHDDTRGFPISKGLSYPEGFVIFDDVFVPNERVLLDGETAFAAVFAHSLGLWERLGSLGEFADDADHLVGFAQLIAEANGTAGISHIKEKISEMIIHATLIRASLEAAVVNCEIGDDGAAFPDELFVNAGKFHGAANRNLMVRHLHDIAGGSVLTAPLPADLDNPDVGDLARKYMSTRRDVDGEYRTRLFHAIRDFTADSYGGYKSIISLQSGGGLYAQRIVTRRHYDLDKAKRSALHLAGIDENNAC